MIPLLLVIAYCAYQCRLLYQSGASILAKLSLLPAMLVIAFMLYLQFLANLGAPIAGLPKARFLYIHHVVANQGKIILLWAYIPKTGNRLYSFPYTRGREKALIKAQEGERQGHPMAGKATGKKLGNGSETFVITNGERLMGHDIPKEHK